MRDRSMEHHSHFFFLKAMPMLVFSGAILEERRFQSMARVHAECKGFKCAPGAAVVVSSTTSLISPVFLLSLSVPAERWGPRNFPPKIPLRTQRYQAMLGLRKTDIPSLLRRTNLRKMHWTHYSTRNLPGPRLQPSLRPRCS